MKREDKKGKCYLVKVNIIVRERKRERPHSYFLAISFIFFFVLPSSEHYPRFYKRNTAFFGVRAVPRRTFPRRTHPRRTFPRPDTSPTDTSTTDTSPKDTPPTDISPTRHFPNGHFPDGHLPDGHFPSQTHPWRTLLRADKFFLFLVRL